MSAEVIDATPLEDATELVQDSSSVEPLQDSSIETQEPETNISELEEAAEKTETQKLSEQTYGEILKDVTDDFLNEYKKQYGEVDSEKSAKLAKRLYDNQLTARNSQRELAELKKQQEAEKETTQKSQLDNQNVEIQQKYQFHLNDLEQLKEKSIAYYYNQKINGEIDDLGYTQALEAVNADYLQRKINILVDYDKENKEYTSKQTEFQTQRKSKLWQEKTDAFKDKLQLDEYKTVIDAYKEAGYDYPEDVDFIVSAVDKAIEAYNKRIANQADLDKQNRQDKSKLKSINDFSNAEQTKTIPTKPTIVDISKMSEEQLTKWALS